MDLDLTQQSFMPPLASLGDGQNQNAPVANLDERHGHGVQSDFAALPFHEPASEYDYSIQLPAPALGQLQAFQPHHSVPTRPQPHLTQIVSCTV